MRQIAWGIVLATLLPVAVYAQSPATNPDVNCRPAWFRGLFGGPPCTPQPSQPVQPQAPVAQTPAAQIPARQTAIPCRFGRSAASRLMCADPKLASLDEAMSRAYRAAEFATAPDNRSAFRREQLRWIQARNQKCGMTGRDSAPVDQLRPAARCMETEITARIAALRSPQQAQQGTQQATQQAVRPGRSVAESNNADPCRSVKGAAARLICADPDLSDANAAVAKAYEEAKTRASIENQKILEHEQIRWLAARNVKCGLTGLDAASLDKLRRAKSCMEAEMTARLAQLTDRSDITASVPPLPNSQALSIQPILEPVSSADPKSANGVFHALRFSAHAEGLGGTITCSAPSGDRGTDPLANTPLAGKWITTIAINGDANSYHMFAGDAWTDAVSSLRSAAQSACASALASGRLRNAANEEIHQIPDAFEARSSDGIFVAYSIGPNGRWIVQTNLVKTRKTIMSDLNIQSWVDASELTTNPYFFQDAVVGVVTGFERMVSKHAGVFSLNGNALFVTGIRPDQFHENEMLVLAARVKGNKGVIVPSGDEVLMPALVYVGAFKCGNACMQFEALPSSKKDPVPTADLE